MKHYEDLIDRLRTATKLPLLQALCNEAADAIAALTAADVRPVKRGKWVSVFDIGTVCNQCGYDIEEHGYDVRTDGEPNFCPNCGADMGEES